MLRRLSTRLSLAMLLMLSSLADAGSLRPTALSEVIAKADTRIHSNETSGQVLCETLNPTVYVVEGDVSAASGSFGASLSDPGFQLHDGTGGVFVLTESHLDLERGDRVQVTGTTHCSSATLSLTDARVSAVSHEGPVVFAPRQIGELAVPPSILGNPVVTPNWCDCLAPFSATAGDVITVRGIAVADLQVDGAHGFKLFLDDGTGVAQIFIDADSEVPVAQIRDRLLGIGADLCVTGVVAQFAGVGFELLSRTGDDIRLARSDKDNPCHH